MYIGEITGGGVSKIQATGGYFINSVLPAGLTFNQSTGAIGGKPTVLSPATTYTITGYNNYSESGAASLSIQVGPPPAPTISYTTPQSYLVNTAITTLAPSSTNVSAAGYSSSAIVVTSGVVSPIAVVVDLAGNLYTADAGNSIIKKTAPGSTTSTTVGSGFNAPYGLAVDAAGNLYVADLGNNAIKKVPAGGGAIATLVTGLNTPTGIAVDGAGNVYIADQGNNQIKKLAAGSTTPVVIGTGFNAPAGVAVDAAGNVYVADSGNNAIKEITAGSNTTVTVASGFNEPESVFVDASGNLFVSDYGNTQIDEVPVNSNTPIVIGGGFSFAPDACVDGAGNVYVADTGNGVVKKVVPSGGYYLNTALPLGLSFSNITGAISGTPKVVSPATNYTVTAYNTYSGSKVATVNIAVSNTSASSNANLAGLVPSLGGLSPAFAAATTSYVINLANSHTAITFKPTTADATATVTVNGAAVASGTNSAAIPLAVGANVISTVVTAQDGVTKMTYNVTVNRAAAASGNANLANLVPSLGGLSPAFAAATTSYLINLANSHTSITFKPIVADATATVTVNGTTVASGSNSAAIPLNVGSNVISTVVTAQDGVTSITYNVTVNRASLYSTNANLANLVPSLGSLSPAFTVANTNYTIGLANSHTSIMIRPIVADATAMVTVNGTAVTSGSYSAAIPLVLGNNAISIVVTAQDGVTKITYTLTVNRAGGSTNANLAGLVPGIGSLSPAFAAATASYTISLANSHTSITFKPTTADPTATVIVNGTAVASGTNSAAIPLNVGNNVISIVVTAQDGLTKITYTVTVNRAAPPSSNANLASITPSLGALTPAFATGTTAYAVNLANSHASIQIRFTVADATATVTINGTTVPPNTYSAAIALAVGTNPVTIISTAQDGVTKITYTVNVNRAAGMSLYVPADSLDIETTAVATDGIVIHPGVSPNGDGINDIFTIDGINAYPENKVTIMGRNGNIIFEAKGYDNQTKFFNGHSSKNGALQLPGTYFYSLEYSVAGKVKQKTGFLVLKY
jgi:gliding motility-associated-like protein